MTRFVAARKSILLPALSLLLLASLIKPAAAQSPIDLDGLKKTVVFIYYSDASGRPNPNVFATGFVVLVPLKSDPSKEYTMIVTARHVVDPAWACSPLQAPTQIFVRVNTKDFDSKGDHLGVQYLPVALESSGKRTWFSHPDPTVDVAVIPIGPATELPLDGKAWRLDDYDVMAVPLAVFATDDEMKNAANIGTSIISAGLVPELAKTRRNYPTFKFGRISNIFDEPIEIPCTMPGRSPVKITGWALAVNFVGGNSGSPVFRYPIDILTPHGLVVGGQRTFFLGLVSNSDLGTDFSVITPMNKILEVIEKNVPADSNLARGIPAPTK